jgi:hypothetical protein
MITCLVFFGIFFVNLLNAQGKGISEKYGNTFNIGVGSGIGNYGYAFSKTPAVHMDYEFDIIRTLTLAPFVTLYHYQNNFYHERVIPVGLKATCYFDQIVKAHARWDFYLAGSLGFAIRETVWENGFTPDPAINYGPGALYMVISIGTEYHINKNFGAYIDLSNGISTIGLSIHP